MVRERGQQALRLGRAGGVHAVDELLRRKVSQIGPVRDEAAEFAVQVGREPARARGDRRHPQRREHRPGQIVERQRLVVKVLERHPRQPHLLVQAVGHELPRGERDVEAALAEHDLLGIGIADLGQRRTEIGRSDRQHVGAHLGAARTPQERGETRVRIPPEGEVFDDEIPAFPAGEDALRNRFHQHRAILCEAIGRRRRTIGRERGVLRTDQQREDAGFERDRRDRERNRRRRALHEDVDLLLVDEPMRFADPNLRLRVVVAGGQRIAHAAARVRLLEGELHAGGMIAGDIRQHPGHRVQISDRDGRSRRSDCVRGKYRRRCGGSRAGQQRAPYHASVRPRRAPRSKPDCAGSRSSRSPLP